MHISFELIGRRPQLSNVWPSKNTSENVWFCSSLGQFFGSVLVMTSTFAIFALLSVLTSGKTCLHESCLSLSWVCPVMFLEFLDMLARSKPLRFEIGSICPILIWNGFKKNWTCNFVQHQVLHERWNAYYMSSIDAWFANFLYRLMHRLHALR